MGKLSIARSFGTTSEAQQIRSPGLGVDRRGDMPCSIPSRGEAHLGAQVDNQQTAGEDITGTLLAFEVHDKDVPIQPRRIADQKLPFVPAEEVAKRDGKEDAKLCSSIVLEIDRILNQAQGLSSMALCWIVHPSRRNIQVERPSLRVSAVRTVVGRCVLSKEPTSCSAD